MQLTCQKCQVKNYLDPYPFWNFEGTTKCGGCAQVYKIKVVNGIPVGEPTPATGKPDLLPGFAERGHEPISGPGLTRPAPRARKDSVCRPIPMERNIKGTILSGKPLKKEDLIGSTAKIMVAGAR